MTKRTRIGIAAATFMAFIFLIDAAFPPLALGLGGGVFFRRRCPPVVVEQCIPDKPPPIPVESPKPPPPIPVDKELKVNVKNIAELLKQGKTDEARELAKAAAANIDEVADLMQLYRPRNKGGLGYGLRLGTSPATDGLEKKLQEFTRAAPAKTIAAQKDNNVEAATWMAALAELTLAKVPAKDGPAGKAKKAWIDWAKDLRDATDDFSKASAAGNAAAMSKAANKMNNACLACHSKFKE